MLADAQMTSAVDDATVSNQMISDTIQTHIYAANKALQLILENRLAEMEDRLREAHSAEIKTMMVRMHDMHGKEAPRIHHDLEPPKVLRRKTLHSPSPDLKAIHGSLEPENLPHLDSFSNAQMHLRNRSPSRSPSRSHMPESRSQSFDGARTVESPNAEPKGNQSPEKDLVYEFKSGGEFGDVLLTPKPDEDEENSKIGESKTAWDTNENPDTDSLQPAALPMPSSSSLTQKLRKCSEVAELNLDRIMYLRRDLKQKTPACWEHCITGTSARRYLLSFLRSVFGISNPNIWTGEPGSRVIHPSSSFIFGMEVFSALLLVYCVALVPVQLSFWNDYWPCDPVPTLPVDMMVDLFFMIEIVIRFFTGVEVNGKYHDDLSTIAIYYLQGVDRFCFDAVTSIPFSWISWSSVQSCDGGSSPGTLNHNTSLIRTVKTLRILKLGRVLKTFKLFSASNMLISFSPTSIRVFKLFFVLSSALHLFACFFWRVKLETNSEDELAAWLEDRRLSLDEINGIYVTCFYFVCTVFFTVGFGDIYATTEGERIFCIFMMSCAACVFGLILGELQEIYANANTKTRELDDHMDSVSMFLLESRVPNDVAAKIKTWMRFQFPQRRMDAQHREIMDALPPTLRQTLACNINKGLFAKVVIWSHISNQGSLKDQFTADLLLRMRNAFYLAESPVATCKEVADRIMIIVSGKISIYEAGHSNDPKCKLLTIGPGGSIGDNTILDDWRWAGLYGVEADYIADENTKICYILADDIKDVISSSPQYLMIRRLFESLRYEPDEEEEAAMLAEEMMERDSIDVSAQEMARLANPQLKVRCIFNWVRFARTILHLEPERGNHSLVLNFALRKWLRNPHIDHVADDDDDDDST